MTNLDDLKPGMSSQTEDQRPSADHIWPFTKSELTAGLRRYTSDPNLKVISLRNREITQRRPAVGKLKGLHVEAEGKSGRHSLDLVLKQTHGSTRTGAAGAGLREASIYLTLKEHLPLKLPALIGAHPKGEWLMLVHLPPGRRPEKWTAADYLLAAEQLAVLHDRFWGLDTHLSVYSWLEQPLKSDREIYLQSIRKDADNLLENTSGLLSSKTDILSTTEKIIGEIETITDFLGESPATLLHGDYWPGNIQIDTSSSLIVYDWEDAAIGPAILDLVNFIQTSSWAFSPLPIPSDEIIAHYRSRLDQAGANTYTNKTFKQLWDYAFMWTFVNNWAGNLAKTPEAILPMRLAALEDVLFTPLRKAVKRRLN